MLAPASNASCVLSTCSAIETGTAGLSSFRGSEPVMATQMMQGSGGLLPLADSSERAAWTVLSGPAGGVIGAAALARAVGRHGLDGLGIYPAVPLADATLPLKEIRF